MQGEITKLGKNRYRIRFSLPRDPVTGKRTRPTKTIHGSKKDAERVLREWIRAYEFGEWNPTKSTTLNQHIDEWLGAAKGDMSETTFRAYSYDLERFVLQTIGRAPIDKIRPLDIQQLFLDLVTQGTGPTSVARLKAALSKCFGQALMWRRVTSNPVIGTQIPGKDKIRRRIILPMTSEQANKFLDAAVITPFLALFEVALSSGMRPGEYQALGWSAVDWDRQLVRVERAVKRPRKQPPRIDVTKNKHSRRSIPLPSKVMESLREHREAMEAERLRLGEAWQGGELDLVFPDHVGKIWDEVNFRDSAFRKIETMAGLSGFTPYSLRHTCATLLLQGGVNPKIVSERLGHSSITLTLDTYSHVLPTMQTMASDTLGQMLFQQYFFDSIGDQVGISEPPKEPRK